MSSQESSDLEKYVIEEYDPRSRNADNLELAKQSSRISARHELSKVTSNTLDRVISRLSTRNIKDPGPAPDGGLKAWTQVAALWTCSLTTW
jgi:hypothetical protein